MDGFLVRFFDRIGYTITFAVRDVTGCRTRSKRNAR